MSRVPQDPIRVACPEKVDSVENFGIQAVIAKPARPISVQTGRIVRKLRR